MSARRSDRSRSRLIAVGAVAFAALVGIVWLRNSISNERHIDELIDMAYDYADIEPGPKLGYNRQDYPTCLEELTDGDAWAGFKASTTGTSDRGDAVSSEFGFRTTQQAPT